MTDSTEQPKVSPNLMTLAIKRMIRKLESEGLGNDSAATYQWPIKAPTLIPGVVPRGETAPVMAFDASGYQQFFDNTMVGGFPGFAYLSQLAMRAEYRAFASSISTETTRKGIEFTTTQSDESADQSNDKIKEIDAEFKRLGIIKTWETCVSHDCLFGRGQMFIDIDGQDKTLPLVLSKSTIKKGSLNSVVPVEAIWTTPKQYNALNPVAPDFYRPSAWFMLGQSVHASRLMTIVTRPLPDMLKPAFNFAGMSLSQLAEPYVNNWLRTRQSVSDLIANFSITALATSMDQVLQDGDDGADVIARAKLFTMMRDNQNLMLLNKDTEELVQVNTPLSGLHELQSQSQEHMCSVSRIPSMILTGISPTGMNASSEGEIRVFYDWIAACQNAYWREPLSVILKVVQLSLYGEIDPNIDFNFVPLYQMTEKELSEIRLNNANSDAVYLDHSVVDQDEVRRRLANDPDSGFGALDLDKHIEVPEAAPGGVEIPGLGDDPDDSTVIPETVATDEVTFKKRGRPRKHADE